eukprot:334163-Chlamydomonas_euryale.AAC.2
MVGEAARRCGGRCRVLKFGGGVCGRVGGCGDVWESMGRQLKKGGGDVRGTSPPGVGCVVWRPLQDIWCGITHEGRMVWHHT